MTPKFSIIIPAYNSSKFILSALRSIELQINPPSYEVLIIDDNSSDNTLDIIKNYAKSHPEVKVSSNNRTKGVAGARNTGFDHAKGEWVTFLDSDDIWETGTLNAFYEAIKAHPESYIFISDLYEETESNNKQLFSDINPVWTKYFQTANMHQQYLRLNDPATIFFKEEVLMRTGSCAINRQLIERVGYCDETLKAAVDMHWFYILSVAVNHIIYIPKPLLCYIRRSGSLTRSIPFGFYGVIAYKKLLKRPDMNDYSDLIKKQIALWSLDKTYYHRKNNEKLKAIMSSFESVFYDYKNWEYWKNFVASLVLR